MIPRVLIVAGSDSGGGAGIQADIKTVTMLGGYAATAIAALTVQNTLGVTGVHPVPPEFVQAQMRAVLDDIGADAIKTGMLGDAEMVRAVAGALPDGVPVVVDPVMVAKGGARLLDDGAVGTMLELLLPKAAIVTPNTPELAALTGIDIEDEVDAVVAARTLLDLGCRAVLAKGGHLEGREVADWLVTRDDERRFASPRIETRHTHGTGCTLASAIAAGLAGGFGLVTSVERARGFVQDAIRHAPGLGAGQGPLGHNWSLNAASHL